MHCTIHYQWTSAAFFAHGHQDPCFGHASGDSDHDDDAQDDEDCDDDKITILLGVFCHTVRCDGRWVD